MTFNSPLFLFLFLPVFLILYRLTDQRYQNGLALAASLIFFAWGQWFYLPLMAVMILANYLAGRRLERIRGQPHLARPLLWGILAINILLLLFFKAVVGYGVGWVAAVLGLKPDAALIGFLQSAPIPLGFSYITFQAIAYQLDIYNEVTGSEKRLVDFSLYLLFFPKIITGPIARYRDIGAQLSSREVTIEDVGQGARRFIIGFAKKALLADQLARIVNPAFGLSSPAFSTSTAWLVLVAYALQLYFDFSGYTDMAIGIARMLGFRLPENFNYPYISKSISEFWRRWHISLSTWFRDYVFYPLEFTRKRANRRRQQLHMLIVFLLTGLWHGLTINFVIWGLIHGLAMVLEMTSFGRWLKKAWPPLAHTYSLAVILLGWVFFRAATPAFAVQFLARLAGSQAGVQVLPFSLTQPLPIIDNSVWLALALSVLFALPVTPALQTGWGRAGRSFPVLNAAAAVSYDLALLVLLVSAVAATISGGLVATIYGGF